MGAHNDLVSYPVQENIDTAEVYRIVVEEAAYEDGHSPYSGTIATSNGFREFTDFPVTDKDSFLRAEDVILARTEKWEHYEHFTYNGHHYFIGWAAS